MSLLSVWQEKKANQVTQGFKRLLPSKAVVIRDCEEKEVDIEELVVGDLIFLRCGSHVPADLRILQTNGLSIESSGVRGKEDWFSCKFMTSGKSHQFEATVDHVSESVSVFDSRNVAFKGSYCVEGDGIGLVIRTGKFTILGGIAHLHHHIPPPRGKLNIELETFANFITIMAICMAVGVFFVGCIVARYCIHLFYLEEEEIQIWECVGPFRCGIPGHHRG